MARLVAWIGIALLSLYLVLFGGGWAGLYRADLRLISVSLAGVTGLTWAAIAWRRPEWRPSSRLLPAIVAALGSLALSAAASRFPRQSIEYFGYAIVLAALYLLLVRVLANPFFRSRMGPFVVALALVLGAAYAAANIARWVDWWGVVGRVTLPPLRPSSESLTFGNPSTVLTIVLLLAIAAIAVIGVGSRGRRFVVGVIVALAAFATLVSGSRAGWIAIGITLIAMLALLAWVPARRRQIRTLMVGWTSTARTRIAFAIAGVGGLGALVILAPVIIRRVTEGGVDLRINFLLAAQRMFSESPLLGTGPGSWVIQRVRYTIAPETDYYIPHAHNIYAQTAAELGVVGAIAGLALVGSLALLVRDALRDPDAARRRWGCAAAIGLTYFAAHQLLDFYSNMPAILFAAALPVAWLDATSTRGVVLRGRSLPISLDRAPVLLAALVFAIASVGLIASELVAATESTAVEMANEGRWQAADAAARDVVARDPAWAPYQMTMGLTAANVGDHQRAADAFRSVAESDDLPEAWLDLAAEEYLLGHPEPALDALNRAARLGLQRPALAMAIGELASRLGETRLSDAGFTRAITLVPSLAGDPWWQSDPERNDQLARIVDAAIAATGEADRWQIALMVGDAARARDLLPLAVSASGTLTPEDVIAAWTGDEAAFRRILAICDARPLDTAALGWAARLEGRRGDVTATNHYLAWAFTVSSGALEAGTELRVSDKPMLDRTAQGGIAEFWGAYTYRRFTPWNLLVPSLVQLTLQ